MGADRAADDALRQLHQLLGGEVVRVLSLHLRSAVTAGGRSLDEDIRLITEKAHNLWQQLACLDQFVESSHTLENPDSTCNDHSRTDVVNDGDEGSSTRNDVVEAYGIEPKDPRPKRNDVSEFATWVQSVENHHRQLQDLTRELQKMKQTFAWAKVLCHREREYLDAVNPPQPATSSTRMRWNTNGYSENLSAMVRVAAELQEQYQTAALHEKLVSENTALERELQKAQTEYKQKQAQRKAEIENIQEALRSAGIPASSVDVPGSPRKAKSPPRSEHKAVVPLPGHPRKHHQRLPAKSTSASSPRHAGLSQPKTGMTGRGTVGLPILKQAGSSNLVSNQKWPVSAQHQELQTDNVASHAALANLNTAPHPQHLSGNRQLNLPSCVTAQSLHTHRTAHGNAGLEHEGCDFFQADATPYVKRRSGSIGVSPRELEVLSATHRIVSEKSQIGEHCFWLVN